MMVSVQIPLESRGLTAISDASPYLANRGVPAARSSRTQKTSCGRFAVFLIALELDRGESAAIELVAARGKAMHDAPPNPNHI